MSYTNLRGLVLAALLGCLSACADANEGGDVDLASASEDELIAGAAPCVVSNTSARCNSQPIQKVGASSDLRRVYSARPTTSAPSAGYPAVILYQGSFMSPATSWNVNVGRNSGFGLYHQVQLVAQLVARGYVVIQPEAGGGTFWSTNTGGNFSSSADGVFVPLLLGKIKQGAFGPVDASRLYATGISSGGYMTSRMAVSFAGQFRALAIQSASYATCGGAFCWVPFALPDNHPPTLFLHGAEDRIVPISTAKTYEARLRGRGVETKLVQNSTAGHEWLPVAPTEIANWFDTH